MPFLTLSILFQICLKKKSPSEQNFVSICLNMHEKGPPTGRSSAKSQQPVIHQALERRNGEEIEENWDELGTIQPITEATAHSSVQEEPVLHYATSTSMVSSITANKFI